MTLIASVGLGIPEHTITQEMVKKLIKQIFPFTEEKIMKYLPVFDNAAVHERQFAVDMNWIEESHTFEEKNNLYHERAVKYSLDAADKALTNDLFLEQSIPYEAVDMIVFVSSTGISTPSLDAYLMNERPFREDVCRMPLWGLGCAGGAMGLGRADDWLQAHPDKTALVICCELPSLTFQKDDTHIRNLIGTAIFGDGTGAVVMTGVDSPYRTYSKRHGPRILATSSHTKKDSTSVMGWDVTNRGLEVIFSKEVPDMVDPFWREHVQSFCQNNTLDIDSIHSFIAHPGGKKVLENMEKSLPISTDKLKHSYSVLEKHGNMSSATVLYVLYDWMRSGEHPNEKSILCALGPGFSSEIIGLEG